MAENHTGTALRNPITRYLQPGVSLIDPAELQKCFINWVQSIAQISEGQVISIDGKWMRDSGEQGKKSIIHMVSAWSNEKSMVLGQLKVNDKSNENTAIPAILDLLMVKGCWITIDAMGCQKSIAAKIKSKEAEYILAVKDNQGNYFLQPKLLGIKKQKTVVGDSNIRCR